MKTDLQKILSISGYPGLYKWISQGRNGIIVESILNGRRMNAAASMQVTNLSNVAIYTDASEITLREILLEIKDRQNGRPAIDHKSDPATLQKFMESILPNYDRNRVYVSHIKKIVEWYNILQSNDMLDFTEEKEEAGNTEEKNEKVEKAEEAEKTGNE